MKYTALKSHLDRTDGKPLASCYVVYGDDAWLRQSAVGMFRALVNPDYASFNCSSVSAADGAEVAVGMLNTFPMFDVLRVVVVPDVQEKFSDADKATYERYLASPNPEAVLVLVCEEGAEKYASFKGAEKVDCNRLAEDEIAVLVDGMLREEPVRTMQRAALHELVSRTLSDMSRISCEVSKLKAYCDGDITRADVCEMTSAEPDVQIFQLSDAVGSGNAGRALEVLDALTGDGVRPMTVLNLLYGYYRRMLHAELHKGEPDADVAALLGIKPGALYHLRRVSGKYSQVRLKKCVDYLHELQFAVLTGKRSEGSAMHDAVLTLLSSV
ncbi:MAG: DNA polymerase III subunit delta [Christensenellales bacterium]|nr:DNA polymerase III subunit delta [Christensenellales bacterium]